MEIVRPTNGIYQCINNPDNKKRYILKEKSGCYSVLVPIEDADNDEIFAEYFQRALIHEFPQKPNSKKI